jgi:hypothetical protein
MLCTQLSQKCHLLERRSGYICCRDFQTTHSTVIPRLSTGVAVKFPNAATCVKESCGTSCICCRLRVLVLNVCCTLSNKICVGIVSWARWTWLRRTAKVVGEADRLEISVVEADSRSDPFLPVTI